VIKATACEPLDVIGIDPMHRRVDPARATRRACASANCKGDRMSASRTTLRRRLSYSIKRLATECDVSRSIHMRRSQRVV
jgi:hypothetical protein